MALVESTRKTFKIIWMKSEDFVSMDPMTSVTINRKDKVNWLKMRWIRFIETNSKSMFFKESMDIGAQVRRIDMDAKMGNIPKVLPRLREAHIKLKAPKIKDLKPLLDSVPRGSSSILSVIGSNRKHRTRCIWQSPSGASKESKFGRNR